MHPAITATTMKKILVIQNKRIGDVLIASVIAQNTKKKFPNSIIDFLVYDYTTGVIENNPNIDNIIPINNKELKKISNLFKLILEIRKNKYGIIFDPYAKFQSKVICLFSGAKTRIGLVKRNKILPFKFYTKVVHLLNHKSHISGKSIENRVHMVSSTFDIPKSELDFVPKIHLTPSEKEYNKLEKFTSPCIMLGVLGSTKQKSMPYEYVAKIIDFITETYDVNVLFNYAPNQKNDALSIYESCKNKRKIIIDIYEDSIRGFAQLMNKCDLLIGNEGGIIHIAKALNKPTFTVFSPYVLKDDWASFEDGKKHTSVHLLEEKPELYNEVNENTRRAIESDPTYMYQQLTPELIIPKLKAFLNIHLQHN